MNHQVHSMLQRTLTRYRHILSKDPPSLRYEKIHHLCSCHHWCLLDVRTSSILCRFEASLGYWTYLPSRPDNTSFYKDLYHCSVLHLSATRSLRCMLLMHRIGVLYQHIEVIHFLPVAYKVLCSRHLR